MLKSNFIQFSLIALIVIVEFSSIFAIGNSDMNYLEIEVSTTYLEAGSNNNVTFIVFNDFEQIYDLQVIISFTESTQDSSSPNIIGIPSWKFEKVAIGDRVELSTVIFVPEDAASKVYTADIELTYKRLGYTSSSTETHTVGFYAQGKIDMIFYEKEIDPNPVKPGESISFSANILNKGTIPAMYTNASLAENDVLMLPIDSYSYLGQVDPNSPAPISLDALVKSKSEEGYYTAEMMVTYEDDNKTLHTINQQFMFEIIESEKEVTPQGPLGGILRAFEGILFPQQPRSMPSQSSQNTLQGPPTPLPIIPVFIVLIVIIGIVIFVRRRRSKKYEFEDESEE
ncbi:hypothetical protein [[Eubacterium] cellulosolvens]